MLTWLLAGIAGAPLLWLATLQTGYVLAYQACDDRATSWVVVPTLTALALAGGLALACLRGYRRSSAEHLPLPFLGRVSLAMAAMIALVLVASAIAPLMLHACD